MRIATIIFYFILAIVTFASIGIWLPAIFEGAMDGAYSNKGLIQNFVTYYVAILVSSSLDYILKLIDAETEGKKLFIIMVTLFNVIVLGATAFVLYFNLHTPLGVPLIYVIFGVIASFIMWWIANFKNKHFDPSVALGGNAEGELT
jgi:hypothetical protein